MSVSDLLPAERVSISDFVAGDDVATRLRKFARRYSRNRLAVLGAVILLGFLITAVLAPALAPHDPIKTTQTTQGIFQSPSWSHLLGTDYLGRDQLSRVIYGSRVALQVAFVAVGIAVGLGVPLGLLAGYVGGWLDEALIMRLLDTIAALPAIVLLLSMSAAVGPSLTNSMIMIGVVFSPGYARLTRGLVLSLKRQPFVESAVAIGVTPVGIMVRHILPNIVAPIIVLASLSAAGVILTEAGLSFLGIGVQPPRAAWGSMVNNAYANIFRSWWPLVGPGAAIVLLVVAFNFVGDGLRDAFDPRLRNR